MTIDNFDWDVKNADSLYDSLNSVTFRFPPINNGDRIEMKGGTGLTTGTPVETVVLM